MKYNAPALYNKRGPEYVPSDAVYIGRPSKWGNPFRIGNDGTRAEVIEKFRQYLAAHPLLVEQAKQELTGRDLVCFCTPAPCHGDVWFDVLYDEGKENVDANETESSSDS